jgi:pre-mRNA-splicing factor RBM22/SLT11
MPEGGELADQNIRDRYYGINDPVAKKMLRRLGEREELEPPADPTIATLYVGNVEPDWNEADLREVFEKHGAVSKVRVVHSKSCAFVTYATRKVRSSPPFLYGAPQAPALPAAEDDLRLLLVLVRGG